jgi:predicted membrane protein|tara:strand:+ start:9974 stop:10681 length:708 start_codon:yes stop_codon:yes gene_type:complete
METKMDRRVLIGTLFLVIGAVLTLDNLDIFDIDLPGYLYRWHTFLVVIGIFMATVREKVGFGVTLIIVGGVFLLGDMADYYWWDFEIGDIFRLWPLVFVAIGASLIFKKAQHRDYEKKNISGDLDFVDELAVFGGAERMVTSKEFKGGKLTSIFGGTDLNLINADLSHGTNVLDVFILFGGCDIRVPADMNVKVKVTAIFGGFSDERKMIAENEANEGKELIVQGLVLFGGGSVK